MSPNFVHAVHSSKYLFEYKANRKVDLSLDSAVVDEPQFHQMSCRRLAQIRP